MLFFNWKVWNIYLSENENATLVMENNKNMIFTKHIKLLDDQCFKKVFLQLQAYDNFFTSAHSKSLSNIELIFV